MITIVFLFKFFAFFRNEVEIELPYDPEIPLLGIDPKEYVRL
jgi:hypothetical protein